MKQIESGLRLAGMRALRIIPITLLLAVLITPEPREAISKGKAAATGIEPTVAVATALREDVPVILRALGTVTSLSAVTVRSQISGYLLSVTSREGQIIRKGEFLAQIDPRPYRASLHQAEGQLLRDLALLKNAQLDLDRFQRLILQDSASHRDLDTAVATVNQFAGAVQSDRAQIETQRLSLEYCRIISPTDGRMGLRQIDAGNFIQPNDPSGLMVITQMQPISVIFVLPQAQLAKLLAHIGANVRLSAEAYDEEDGMKLSSGVVSALDNQIDPATGTVKLRAEFSNTDKTLFPNQFVNIRLMIDQLRNAVTVPNEAVRPGGASGSYLFVVRADKTIEKRSVVTGTSNRGRVVITDGLKAGEVVVTDGTSQLDEGMRVSVP